jgi:indoleacetamide hydrolase
MEFAPIRKRLPLEEPMIRRNNASRREFLQVSAALGVLPLAPQLAQAQSPLTALTAVEAVRAMREGEVRAEAYAGALLARCAALKDLNAFISLDPEQVLEAARKADLARGRGARLGALHGLPVAIKDSIHTADYPTTGGTNAFRDYRPDRDAPVVGALKRAGAIVLGKTNLHELSYGFTSNNEAFGPVRNPYDRSRIPGGSTGGTAVAVAAHMASCGLAEDTCGSIRVPAALCGISGLRPTTPRYPQQAVIPITPKFDQVGPHARTGRSAQPERPAAGRAAGVLLG